MHLLAPGGDNVGVAHPAGTRKAPQGLGPGHNGVGPLGAAAPPAGGEGGSAEGHPQLVGARKANRSAQCRAPHPNHPLPQGIESIAPGQGQGPPVYQSIQIGTGGCASFFDGPPAVSCRLCGRLDPLPCGISQRCGVTRVLLFAILMSAFGLSIMAFTQQLFLYPFGILLASGQVCYMALGPGCVSMLRDFRAGP